jgi:glyoxylase-like metal-dependent hydrolase (beta-lactamase superfamily II)
MSNTSKQIKQPAFSRRQVLQSFGLGAVGLGLAACQPIQPVVGGITAASKLAPIPHSVAFYRTQLGDFQVTVIGDGIISLESAMLGVNAPEGGVDELLATHNLPTGNVKVGINALLIETGDKRILLDTGMGDFRGLGDNVGHLAATLALLQIKPTAINAVVLSHMHPDHIAGATLDDKPVFPNATYYLPQAEWDFLNAGPTNSPLDDFINLANAKLAPIQANDQLTLYSAGDELVSGIQAVAALGHTPGHHALLVASGNSQLLYLADTVANSLVHLQHPEWVFGFDTLPDVSITTRQQLLNRVADEQLQVVAAHFPFPGVGYISRSGDAFHYVAAG